MNCLDYALTKELGSGHYCETYLAEDRKRKVEVVIKFLKPVRISKVCLLMSYWINLLNSFTILIVTVFLNPCVI